MTMQHDPPNNGPRALRYLDALDAGDLETVAALWDEASSDPGLERTLMEMDRALSEERQAPALRVRASATGWRYVTAIGVAGALAASSLVAIYLWREHGQEQSTPLPQSGALAQTTPPRVDRGNASSEDTGLSPLSLRRLNLSEPVAYNWPFDNTFSMSTPLDRLD